MGLIKATHRNWGNEEPHTFIRGVDPIDGVWHTPDLDVSTVLQLSFHEGLGSHRTVLVDVTTHSAIGKHEFKVIQPNACTLNSTNTKVWSWYILNLEKQMAIHRMTEPLEVCGRSITCFPTSEANKKTMQFWTHKWRNCNEAVRFSVTKPFLLQCHSASLYGPATSVAGPIRAYSTFCLESPAMSAMRIGMHCDVAFLHHAYSVPTSVEMGTKLARGICNC